MLCLITTMGDILTNTIISDTFFGGETVPSANTITETRNNDFISRAENKLKSILRVTSFATDTYGDFLEAALQLYDCLLNGEPMKVDSELKLILKRRYRTPAMNNYNPLE